MAEIESSGLGLGVTCGGHFFYGRKKIPKNGFIYRRAYVNSFCKTDALLSDFCNLLSLKIVYV